jgi:hypothetical protein
MGLEMAAVLVVVLAEEKSVYQLLELAVWLSLGFRYPLG